eukprot:TRINITY_DN754_c0_g1_i1.p3 TRINITY_DN754_c0_g1~~TRINITY_DN754_c0_g1_i1.p3  ORF type:complete len:295 (+),score=50.36 TRINITY_DN754_c0_g1_i1:67-885(+)
MSDTEQDRSTVPTPQTEETDAVEVDSSKDSVSVQEHVNEVKEVVKPALHVTPTETKKKCIISVLQANPFYPKVSALVHWRDPVKSGLVFGIITCSYILLGWFDYTVLTLISYLLFALLAVCFGYAQFVHFRATWVQGRVAENPFVQNFKGVDFHVSKEVATHHLNTVLDIVNLSVDRFTEVFFITNTILALKYLAYFYVLASIGEWFSGLTLAYLVVLIAFVWPRTYEEKKKEIDNGFDLAKAEYKKYSALAVSKLPPAVRKYVEVLEKKRD